MSRSHNFRSKGHAVVRMECGWCEKTEWVAVTWDDSGPPANRYVEVEDPCLAHLAAEQSDHWRYTHDAYVCSEACAERWWEL